MTKFKFGDKVMHCDYGYGIVIDSEVSATLGQLHEVAFKGFRCGMIETVKELNLKPATDWVKCSERMPEHGDMVLVFNGNSIEIDALATGGFDFECWCDSITHWMPLPDMPEVKE